MPRESIKAKTERTAAIIDGLNRGDGCLEFLVRFTAGIPRRLAVVVGIGVTTNQGLGISQGKSRPIVNERIHASANVPGNHNPGAGLDIFAGLNNTDGIRWRRCGNQGLRQWDGRGSGRLWRLLVSAT